VNTDVQDLTPKEYELFRRLVYAKSGINLGDHKMQLVRARLGKRLRQRGLNSFRDYYRMVEEDPTGEELCGLLDAITTNTTHLFREIRHFKLLGRILRDWANDKSWRARNHTLRVWSAACSSGEEPHSIAMVVHDAFSVHRDIEVKILATDLSTQVLSKAQLGLYEPHRVGTVPPEFKKRYLQSVREGNTQYVQVVPELRRMITFARFNLMSPTFPFRSGFHIIFCRNVMIYFDHATQEALVNKHARHLLEGGYLMIGHSESLNGMDHPLTYVEPTVYRK
jgi:chemotaxis protein methyltransferase CheR